VFDLIRKEGVGGSRAEWVMYSVCCRSCGEKAVVGQSTTPQPADLIQAEGVGGVEAMYNYYQ